MLDLNYLDKFAVMKAFLWIILSFGIGTSDLSLGNDSLPPEASAVMGKYSEAESRISQPITSLKDNYLGHLGDLMSQKKAEGALEAVVEIQDEIRFTNDDDYRTDIPKDPELRRAKRLFFQSRENMLRKIAPQQLQLLEILQDQLRKVSDDLTRVNKIDEALSVKEYATSLQEKLVYWEKMQSFDNRSRFGQPDWAYIETAVQKNRLRDTEKSDDRDSNYRVLGDNPSILVGFRLALNDMNDHRIVRGIQPIFRGTNGKDVISDVSLGTRNPKEHRKVVAKPNYAVGSIEFEKDPHIRKMKVHFYRIIGRRLNLEDTYSTEWYGEWDNATKYERVDAGNQIPIGIHGNHGLGMDSIGLILVDAEG